jgi:hypothetical protein
MPKILIPVKHLQVVRVKDVPPKIERTKFGNVIEKVYSLPKGCGLKLTPQHDKKLAIHRAMGITQRGRDCGKPVSIRIRFCDPNTTRAGWTVFVFRRTDLTKRRGGKDTR